MPRGQPAGAEQALELGDAQPCADPRQARDRVDVLDGVQAREVEGHDGGEAPALGVDAPDDARPAAEGHDGDARARADLEHGPHLLVAGRQDDGILGAPSGSPARRRTRSG